MAGEAAGLTAAEVLARMPQQRPFRFVDELLEVDGEHAVGVYTFRPDEWFYAGHFPGRPITPGVILLEAMAQVGLVSLGLYLLALDVGRDEVGRWTTLFSDAAVDFARPVLPGDRVTIRARKEFWRRYKLRSHVDMVDDRGEVVAHGTVSGMGVRP